MDTEAYICKKEIDWSVLNAGFTLPYEHQVEFYQNMDSFMSRGDRRRIKLFMEGQLYEVELYNVNNPADKRKKDCYQLRYSKGSDFATALRGLFNKSSAYFENKRKLRAKGDRTIIRLPEDAKEYLAIYTTEDKDTFLVEPIFAEDLLAVQNELKSKEERYTESVLNLEVKDPQATLLISERTVKIRKLNKKIGDSLKRLYGYRCQLCGKLIGVEFGCSHVVESHHIEYFTKSLNNDASNQIIVCPNHHTIIHEVEPVFDRRRKLYLFKNGVEQKLVLNEHL